MKTILAAYNALVTNHICYGSVTELLHKLQLFGV